MVGQQCLMAFKLLPIVRLHSLGDGVGASLARRTEFGVEWDQALTIDWFEVSIGTKQDQCPKIVQSNSGHGAEEHVIRGDPHRPCLLLWGWMGCLGRCLFPSLFPLLFPGGLTVQTMWW